MAVAYKLGDFVWAKMKNCPPWPAKISAPIKDLKKPKPGNHCVYFFGTHDYALIEDFNIKPYLKHRDQLKDAYKQVIFKKAVQEIEQELANEMAEGGENKSEGEAEQASEGAQEEAASPFGATTTPRKSAKKKKIDSSDAKSDDGEASGSAHDETSSSPTPKRARKSKKAGNKRSSTTDGGTSSSKKRRIDSGTPDIAENGTFYKSTTVKNYDAILNRPNVLERPDTPPVDMSNVSELMKSKKIQPSSLRFGFLGLGIMASGIVKNLINFEHRVNLWCETPSKCEEFKTQADAVKEGLVETYPVPCDVVRNSDIIFSCLSGPKASKDVVVGNCGVLHEISSLEGKGFVEMTGIDAETSKDIHDVITGQGGRYLEAQIQGNKTDADKGNLVVLGAGDRTLFDECQSCFKAMGRTAFYLGEIGYAAKINSILQVISGIALAGLAEGFALADRIGVMLKDLVEILGITNLNCPFLKDKAETIINDKFQECQYPLQYMQRDMRLALQLADSLQQPLLMTSTANEIYKHARRLGYDKHDDSSIFMRVRY